MYQLKSEDLTHLGGPMGTEFTTINYIKPFSTPDKAKKFAEKEYKGEIKWRKGRNGLLTSGDLGYVMYSIEQVAIDPEK